MPAKNKNIAREWFNTIFYGALIAIVFRSFLLEPFNIPSGSMIPTLHVGDHIFVEKWAYGYSRYSFPFGSWKLWNGRFWATEPEVGDVIVAVDGSKVKNMAQMQEMFTKHQPGDKVELTIVRNKKEKKVDVTLKNVQGNTSVVKNADLDMLGATFKELDDKDKRLYNVNYGLKVLDVAKGRFADAGIKKGFVVLKVNNTPVKSVDDMQKAVKQANSSSDQVLFIAGVTPSGKRAYFSVDLTQE
jgi:signal peptidase I